MAILKKIISISIVALMAVMTISGPIALRSISSKATAPELETQIPNVTATSPILTSRDIDCYVLENSLCDRNAKPVTEYRLDESKNIADLTGDIVVSAENTEQFSCAREIRYNESELRQPILTSSGTPGKETVRQTPFTIQMLVQPADAVNSQITLTSESPALLHFPYEPGEDHQGSGSETAQAVSSVTVSPDESGRIEVQFIAVAQGHATVTVQNVLKEEIGRLEFVLLADESTAAKHAATEVKVSASTGSVPSTSETFQKTDTSDGHEHVFKTQTMSPTIRTKGYTLHVCTICGYTYRDNYTDLDLCQHKWRVVKNVAATDSSAGYTLYECTVCGQQERRDPPQQTLSGGTQACSHLICSKKVTPATCTTAGYTYHECLICHDYSYVDEETHALGHSWDEGTITRQPTCLESGIRTFTCKNCGEMKTETVQATGHAWNAGIVTVTPAEENAGVRTYICQTCGEVKTEEIPAIVHDWDEGVVTLEPTCSSAGVKTYTCRLTGATRTEELEKLPHTMAEEIVPPTSSEGGYTRHYCTECGFEGERSDFTDPLQHVHEYELSGKEPTCTEEGYSVYICKSCGDEKERTVLEALGHWYEITPVEPTDEEEGYIDFSCTRCDHSFQGFHLKPPVSYELSENSKLDPDAVAEAGRKWLRENGLEIDDSIESTAQTVSIDINAKQDAAESVMERLCFDSAVTALRQYQEDPSLRPVFNCVCTEQEGTGIVELQCRCSFIRP